MDDYIKKYYLYILKNINDKEKVAEALDQIYSDGFSDAKNEEEE